MNTATNKPKILLITRNFPPLTGGMERLMQKAAEGMSQWADITIVGPTGAAQFAPVNTTVFEAPASLAGFLSKGTLQAIQACRQTQFDLVIGGSGLVAPILYIIKRVFKVPTAIFIHGLDIVVDNTIYQSLFVPAVRRCDLVIANSSNTQNLAINKGVPKTTITVINPGTDLPDLSSIASREEFCSKFNISFQKILLFTGRITKRKGLSQFIASSLPDILAAVPNAGLIVVGENPKQSLNKQGEVNEVLTAIEQLQLNDKVRFLGQVSDDDLWAAYRAADVQIFPLINVPGDVEGFGMVAIETAACGTPTVAYNVGGVSDAISPTSGALVEQNQFKLFSKAVKEKLLIPEINHYDITYHAESFSWTNFHKRLFLELKPHIY